MASTDFYSVDAPKPIYPKPPPVYPGFSNPRNRTISVDACSDGQYLFEPEYIQEQRTLLKRQIRAIMLEIQPLQERLKEYQIQEEAPTKEEEEDVEEFDPNKEVSLRLSQLHAEDEQLIIDLGRFRRIYSEAAQQSIREDIAFQKAEIASNRANISQLQDQISECKETLNNLIKSKMSEEIDDQKDIIQALKARQKQLFEEEKLMQEKYKKLSSRLDQQGKKSKTISKLERQLALIEHNISERKVALAKMKKDFAAEQAVLKDNKREKRRKEAEAKERLKWAKRFKDSILEATEEEECPIQSPEEEDAYDHVNFV